MNWMWLPATSLVFLGAAVFLWRHSKKTEAIPEWLNKRTGKDAIMYLAYPTELFKNVPGIGERLTDFSRKRGFAPINPFQCGDFEDFEGGIVGRKETINWTLHLQRGCGWSGYFGVSHGALSELRDRIRWDFDRKIRLFIFDENGKPFDPCWEKKYEELKSLYGDLFAQVRGKNKLIIFVGPSAIGKDYWIERLMGEFKPLQRVKNVTTRDPRNKNDVHYYRISHEQFEDGIRRGVFLEHDKYLGEYYGSSFEEVRKTLDARHGIFAMTPKGVKEWYNCRLEINISVVVLKPVSEEVLVRNLMRRNETDPVKIREKLRRAKDFVLPPEVEHVVVPITGDADRDRPNIFDAVLPLLK